MEGVRAKKANGSGKKTNRSGKDGEIGGSPEVRRQNLSLIGRVGTIYREVRALVTA
jgi:hypothetical protein